MQYISVKQAAEQWGVTTRRVQDLCNQGRIPGAQRWERSWMLPANAVYPARKTAASSEYNLPMPRKSPFLTMTDLYNTPGSAQKSIDNMEGQPEAQELFAAEVAYHQGEMEAIYGHINTILRSHSGFYSVIAGGMLLSLCAMWTGDLSLWNQAKIHICEAPCRSKEDQDILDLALASVDLAIGDNRKFPEWFRIGCFERLPPDAHPAAKVYYMKYMIIWANEVALDKNTLDGTCGLGSMRAIPFLLEPLISQAMVDRTVLVELYLRLMCATVYKNTGNLERATMHLDRAIALALPDRLYGPLVEQRRHLGYLLDDRLALVDEEALKRVKLLDKQLHQGWIKLHNQILQRNVSGQLSVREREVARLAAFGLTDAEIADQLNLSRSTVKSLVAMAKNKTGAVKRNELAIYL